MSTENTGKQRSIAVFCAAADGARPVYRAVAEKVGRGLAARGFGLIYGGAKIGLMGAVADAALAAGGQVVGVIPQVLVEYEVAHAGVTELHIVDTMHTRKALMAERASAFLILPGGIGTFEEMFEVWAWQSLKIHAKPIVLLNVEGYYDGMMAWLENCELEGMMRGNLKRLLVATTVNEALTLCEG